MKTAIDSQSVLRAAQNSLLSFCIAHNPNFETPTHLIKLARALERVERGEIKRLIVTIPPRHGKSYITSETFPAWFIGRNPEKYIISATYAQELSEDFGRKVKHKLQDPLTKAIFPKLKLMSDSQSVNRINTTNGGAYYSLGVGGAVTGRGAHFLLIDDPIKNREEAESELIRQKIIDWYTSTAYTRLMPGGAVVVVMARWHKGDLVGHLLKNASHENWHVIDLPAISDDKPLWPERYDLETLNNIRLNNEYDFQSLYMQRPMDSTGNPVKAEWIKPSFQGLSKSIFKITYIDPAISQKKTADETSIVTTAFDFMSGKYRDVEVVRGRWDYDTIKSNAKSAYNRNMPDCIYVETVQAQDWLRQDLNSDGIPAQAYRPDKDKVGKAMSVQDLFSRGEVETNDPELQKQLINLRTTKHDDVADGFLCTLIIGKELNLSSQKINAQYSQSSSPASSALQKEAQEIQNPSDGYDDYLRFLAN